MGEKVETVTITGASAGDFVVATSALAGRGATKD